MSGEGFLSRWSRLKRGEAREPEPQPEAPPAEAAPEPAPAETAEEAEEFDLASLPPIESLTAESDISVFLRAGVPQALRNAALRRAWSLDPTIRDFIGPADYAWDYNAPDGVPGFATTLAGDLKKLLSQAIGEVAEEDKAEAKAAAEPPARQETPQETLQETLQEMLPGPDDGEQRERQPQSLAEAPEDDPPPADKPPEPPPARRRHGGAMPS